MTPLHVPNRGDSPAKITYSANPAAAISWLKASPVTVPPGKTATIPVTLVVPSDAAAGESYVVLTAGRSHFDVRFSVSAAAPRQCVAAGYNPPSSNSSSATLWVIVLIVVVLVALWYRGRRKKKK
jgi:cobalamin biosynthesis Mg chelatase CobN